MAVAVIGVMPLPPRPAPWALALVASWALVACVAEIEGEQAGLVLPDGARFGVVRSTGELIVFSEGTDGSIIAHGDIEIADDEFDEVAADEFAVLLEAQQKTRDEISDSEETTAIFANGDSSARLWPGGRVYYFVPPSTPALARDQIDRAIRHYHRNTGIRFYPRTSQSDYIYLEHSSSCQSQLGRQGGAQKLQWSSRSTDCGYGDGFSVLVHELGHAIGLHHEQQRKDRDTYIRIDTSVMSLSGWQQIVFQMGTPVGPYDYNSIMHYQSFAAGLSKPTIVRPDSSRIEPARGLSYLDRAAIARLYGFSVPRPPCGVLWSGMSLRRGKSLYSCDRRFRLINQNDGNVVLYRVSDGRALWWSGSVGSDRKALTMQQDGNLVLSRTGGVAWSLRTDGVWGAFLMVQDDGNLVLYRKESGRLVPHWQAGTYK